MGTDANHHGDSSQHTAPLPTPAVLPSDTPIAPTPDQVNEPGSEPWGQDGGPDSGPWPSPRVSMETTVVNPHTAPHVAPFFPSGR